jgi:hypothetical protein
MVQIKKNWNTNHLFQTSRALSLVIAWSSLTSTLMEQSTINNNQIPSLFSRFVVLMRFGSSYKALAEDSHHTAWFHHPLGKQGCPLMAMVPQMRVKRSRTARHNQHRREVTIEHFRFVWLNFKGMVEKTSNNIKLFSPPFSEKGSVTLRPSSSAIAPATTGRMK